MIYLSDNQKEFPNSFEILDDDLVGYGGTLTPELILSAYAKGVFPMYTEPYPNALWFCPIPRLLLAPNKVRVQKSIRSALNKFTYSVNLNFTAVMEGCANTIRKGEEGTWINQSIYSTFNELNNLGFAYSIETRLNNELVGGLYGLSMGACFFGESMFQQQTNASKCALIVLCKILEHCGHTFVDCQQATPHLTFMGGELFNVNPFFKKLSDGLNEQKPSQKLKDFSRKRFSFQELVSYLNQGKTAKE